MVFCQALTAGGSRCGRDATDQSYFWFYDQHQRINRTFHLCQDHSNQIINTLIAKENGYKIIIDTMYKKIESLRALKNKNANFKEQRDAIIQAKKNGLAKPKFKSVEKINKEIQEFFRKIKKFKELKTIERRHTCRYSKCGFLLDEPNDIGDQVGNKFNHADFHSGKGKWRESIHFHTECGVTWLLGTVLLIEKELKYVRPQRTNQGVLFNE